MVQLALPSHAATPDVLSAVAPGTSAASPLTGADERFAEQLNARLPGKQEARPSQTTTTAERPEAAVEHRETPQSSDDASKATPTPKPEAKPEGEGQVEHKQSAPQEAGAVQAPAQDVPAPTTHAPVAETPVEATTAAPAAPTKSVPPTIDPPRQPHVDDGAVAKANDVKAEAKPRTVAVPQTEVHEPAQTPRPARPANAQRPAAPPAQAPPTTTTQPATAYGPVQPDAPVEPQSETAKPAGATAREGVSPTQPAEQAPVVHPAARQTPEVRSDVRPLQDNTRHRPPASPSPAPTSTDDGEPVETVRLPQTRSEPEPRAAVPVRTSGEGRGEAQPPSQSSVPASQAPQALDAPTAQSALRLATAEPAARTDVQATYQPATQTESQAFQAAATRGLSAALRQSGGTVTVRLIPETLGAIRVHMQVADGRVSVRLETGGAQAQELLAQHLATLRAGLEQRGLKVDEITTRIAPELARQADGPQHNQQANNARDRGGEHAQDHHGGRRQAQQDGEHPHDQDDGRGAFAQHDSKEQEQDEALATLDDLVLRLNAVA